MHFKLESFNGSCEIDEASQNMSKRRARLKYSKIKTKKVDHIEYSIEFIVIIK